MINLLSSNEALRLELAYRLNKINKRTENYYLPEFFASAGLLRPERAWVFRVLQIILAVTVMLAVLNHTVPFLIAAGVSIGINLIVYCLMKIKYDILLSSMSGIGNVLDLYSWCIYRKDHAFPASDQMWADWKVLRKLRKKIGFLVYTRQASATGDVLGLMFDYLLGVTLIDVGRIDGILRLISETEMEILQAFTYVGMLDAVISVLSFRESLPEWTMPSFTDKGILSVNGLYHPLLKNPVSNDFTLRDRAVITGANASGKSTFMKALAVNTVLAQTIDTCSCTSIFLPRLRVMTSMAIRDDVISGESYYVREVRYLKRMLDEIGRETPTLYVVDEILKGTNQKERLVASKAVLNYISKQRVYCVLATHDMLLVDHLQDQYEPYYFESHIENNNVKFDYQINKGRGGDSNALALLKAFGFPEEVIECAYALANA